MARLGDPAPIEAIRASNWEKHTKDALLAATHQYEGLILVTQERRLTNFARRELKLTVWDWSRLYARLRTL